jgi:hypothetical protein
VIDRLAHLISTLERTGQLPPHWEAPDEDLRAAWAACPSGATLLHAAMAADDQRGLVLAASACARAALGHVTPGDERARRAIDLAEAWTRGEATAADVERASVDAEAAASAAASNAEFNACCAASVAARTASRVRYTATHVAAVYVAEAAMPDDPPDDDAAPASEAVLATLADVVRAHVQCPTLEQLRAAFPRRFDL